MRYSCPEPGVAAWRRRFHGTRWSSTESIDPQATFHAERRKELYLAGWIAAAPSNISTKDERKTMTNTEGQVRLEQAPTIHIRPADQGRGR